MIMCPMSLNVKLLLKAVTAIDLLIVCFFVGKCHHNLIIGAFQLLSHVPCIGH